MFCMRCQNAVGDCTCPDISERLVKLAGHPNIAIEFCVTCGQHHARCKCGEKREPIVLTGNQK
jgi:hypothetical protein